MTKEKQIISSTIKINTMNNKKIRALLLEDNEDVRGLIATLLKSRGYEVLKFSTPAMCPLQKTPNCTCGDTSRCADIILSDLGMPFVSGIEFIKNQRNKQCKAPYMAMMSGNWHRDEAARAAELGCKVFSKPFHIAEINEWLDYVEKNINLNRELSNDIFENSGGI